MIGRWFSYNEMTATGTRALNKPNQQQLINLTRLVALILDPLRVECGALLINSGFRSELVNDMVGGSAKSYHMKGCAADIRSNTKTIIELADSIEMLGLPFDKVIMEYGTDSEWLHVQLAMAGGINRGEVYVSKMNNGKMEYTLT